MHVHTYIVVAEVSFQFLIFAKAEKKEKKKEREGRKGEEKKVKEKKMYIRQQ